MLRKASEKLDDEAPYSVRQDFTQRVRKHRRALGKEMIAEMKTWGQQARIKIDKLEIEGDLYRYGDATEKIVLIPSGNFLEHVVEYMAMHGQGQVTLYVICRRGG